MYDSIELPLWINVVLIAGLLAASLTSLNIVLKRTSTGMSWLGKLSQAKILAPARADITRIDAKLDGLLQELTSDNGGSIREQVNGTRKDLLDHIKISAQDREALRLWLEHVDPDGPPKDLP